MGQQGFQGIDDEAEVRLAVVVQRCGYAQDQGIGLAGLCEIGACLETSFGGFLDGGIRNVFDATVSGLVFSRSRHATHEAAPFVLYAHRAAI